MEGMRLALLPFEDAPGAARRAVRAACAELDEQLRARVELVGSELVANAVEHALLEQSKRIELQLQVEQESCRVEVDDPGIGFTSEPQPVCADAEPSSGRGLFLVSALSRRWGVERVTQKTRVWAEIA